MTPDGNIISVFPQRRSQVHPSQYLQMCDCAIIRKAKRTIRCADSCLTTETVEGTALSLQSVNDVERGDGLALGVLSVGDGVTDDTLEEGLENTTGLLVNH